MEIPAQVSVEINKGVAFTDPGDYSAPRFTDAIL